MRGRKADNEVNERAAARLNARAAAMSEIEANVRSKRAKQTVAGNEDEMASQAWNGL